VNYQQLDVLLQGRNKGQRKLANNTYARRCEDHIAIRLHDTDIMRFTPKDVITIDTGGWRTSTTKERINNYTPGPWRVFQRNGVWGWWMPGDGQEAMFSDGDIIRKNRDGLWQLKTRLTDKQAQAEAAKQQRLRRKIMRYAQACADAVPLPMPGAGDCFYCHGFVDTMDAVTMKVTKGCKDTTHLHSHMDEGYVVPTLVHHALKEHHSGPVIFAGAFGSGAGFMKEVIGEHVKRAVRKYMSTRLGLA
jgi:hypothetical protein